MPDNASEARNQKNVVMGLGAGGAAGAGMGALVGGLTAGPVGAIAGATLGGMVGSVSGGAMTYGDAEPELRQHYESGPNRLHPWETVAPSYRYGWESHDRPELQGKSWDQVRTDLEKGWTHPEPWSDHEHHVRRAWERRAQAQGQDTDVVETVPRTVVPEELSRDNDLFQGADPLASLTLGGTAGATLGGLMGLLLGGPIGLALGGTLGTIAGALATDAIMSDWHEIAFQHHHETEQANLHHPWQQARIGYAFGWFAHDMEEASVKTWDEARPALARAWKGPGSFEEFEPYIKYGWDKRIPKPAPTPEAMGV